MLESLVIACAVAFATCIRSEPPVPEPHAPFDLVYEGHWMDTTVPTRLVSAVVEGRDIRVAISTDARRGQYFQQAVTPFAVRLPAAAFAPEGLPPGTYRVLVEVDRDGPFEYRYEATFGLVDVGRAGIAPRSGPWRALEPATSGGNPGELRRDCGLRMFVDTRPEHVRVVATGAREVLVQQGAAQVAYAWPTSAEGLLPREPRHVEGMLHSPITTRFFDGRLVDRRQLAIDRFGVAIEWIDPRNGILHLPGRDRNRPVTSLPLVFDDGLRAPGALARRWLVTRVQGDSVRASSIAVLEEAGHTPSAWNYRDALSQAVLRCVPVRGEPSHCILFEPRGGARATLVCGSDGCDGHDARGARVAISRWD